MALEDVIAKLTAAVERNNELVEKVLAQAGASSDTPTASDEEKPKRGRKPKEAAKTEESDDADEKSEAPKSESKKEEKSGDVDFAGLKKRLSAWLGEFAKEEDKENPDGMHPEAKARKEAVKAAIKKLGGEKLTDIGDNQESVNRLGAWLDKKLEADAGFGKGRLAADPEPAGNDDEDEDDI